MNLMIKLNFQQKNRAEHGGRETGPAFQKERKTLV
jgi:hypothetical protein